MSHEKIKDNNPIQTQSFVPPRHWLGVEELTSSYWNDPKIQERRGQEFYDKPVETIEFIEKLDTKGIARRDFLTLMSASMAMTGLACARRPVNKIIPYVVQPEEIVPGVANWYASTCPMTALGVLIKTREGRPIKLEGNPDHPSSNGSLSARAQAGVLDLYDQDRLKGPLTRSDKNSKSKPSTWDEANAEIQRKLKASAEGSGRVKILSQPILGESTRKLVKEFLSAFKAGALVEYEPLNTDTITDSQKACYGTAVIPRYDLSKADLIVSFGADFLGTWLNPVEQASLWAQKRKLNGKDPAHSSLSKLICFESSFSLTGANADERIPVRPGDELKIALAIAHELIINQKRSSFAGNTQVISVLQSYEPKKVAAEIGLSGGAESLKKTAAHLWEARGKSLVLGGGISTESAGDSSLQVAVNILNSALENEGVTVDGMGAHKPQASDSYGFAALNKLIGEMKAGRVDVLILHRTNPVYFLPKEVGFEAALKRVPTVIAIADREDETAMLADFVLPEHHYLENWGDYRPRQELYSLQQPAIAPLHDSKSFQDCLLTWVWAAGIKASGLISRGPISWHDYLKLNWKETIYKNYNISGSFDRFWEATLQKGVFDGVLARGLGGAKSQKRTFVPSAVSEIPIYRKSAEGLRLALYPKISIHDGTQANNAWLQEMPDPISTVTWDNYLNVSPKLAKELGFQANDVAEVKTGDLSVQVPVLIQPGLHPSVVTLAVGYGRWAAGKIGNGVGVNAFQFAKMTGEQLAYSGQPVQVVRTGKVYKLAETQWHHSTENRPIINDITLSAYKKNPKEENHTDPHLRMEKVPTVWPEHEYKGAKWGMSIDLNSCTGCGACVIGCQSENNIPVVGRDNVQVSREMHWIRLDRYYSGTPDNPDVVFQPMLCQHCDNAPCETVCPVLATVHSSEGLNEQIYNRCVGTRYCQNNCPYKVRRFNFFDHWKGFEGNTNLVWNPDISVRTRGIMEKCTFCVQRIRDAKEKAKDQGVAVQDGDFKTACQQTCPTEAIVFGDMNDPKSKVSQQKGDARAFRVLEIVNAKPSISYLTKVRNKEPEKAQSQEHGKGENHHG